LKQIVLALCGPGAVSRFRAIFGIKTDELYRYSTEP
jgi:hypothetical protein